MPHNITSLVFATNNPHKLEEVRRMAGHRFPILSLSDIGCHEDIPETAPDLEGNSLLKARFIKERYGYDCFADDTGLLVDALDGAPGVLSARYAGPACSPDDNMELLLHNLEHSDNRRAHFATVITLITAKEGAEDSRNPDDWEIRQFRGEVHGSIARERSGHQGFGYDPIFVPDETGVPFAEMEPQHKNSISHRGRAMAALFNFLDSPGPETGN